MFRFGFNVKKENANGKIKHIIEVINHFTVNYGMAAAVVAAAAAIKAELQKTPFSPSVWLQLICLSDEY